MDFKFRVYDKTTDEMYRVGKETQLVIGMEEENRWSLWTEEGMICDCDDAVLMQYTGLKDKNGKEIYEGDIVQYLDGYETSTESGYDCEEFNNRGVIFFDNECGRYDVTNKEGLSYDDLFDCGVDFIVLGNIYKNPDLIPND